MAFPVPHRASAALVAVLVCLTFGPVHGATEVGVARVDDTPSPHAPRPAVQAARPSVVIHVHGGLLSVKIRHASWDEVVQAITRQTGILLQVKGALTGTVNQEFEALPLAQGLRRLWRDANVVFVSTSGIQADGTPTPLIRIWFAPTAAPTPDASQSPRASAPVATTEPSQPPGAAGKPAEVIVREDSVRPAHISALEDERLTALQALAEQGNTAALQQALFDPDQRIQATALALFARWDPQGGMEAMLAAKKSEEPAIRVRALSLLHQGNQGDDGTVLAALEEALADHDVTVKSYALHALAERGTGEAMEALRQVLRDPDIAMRKMVLEEVASTAQGRALLQEALANEDATIRSLAAFWLEEAASDGQ